MGDLNNESSVRTFISRSWKPEADVPEAIARENRLAAIGPTDWEATQQFQAYELPGQTNITPGMRAPRNLLDPEEYAIAVSGTGWNELAGVAEEDRKDIASWKVWNGEPPKGTYLSIIVGRSDDPSTCYRYGVDEIILNEDRTLTVIVQNNLEHDREVGGYELPKELSMENWVLMQRTGQKIIHQRMPVGMTMFKDKLNLKINPEKDTVWVVAKSGSGIEKASIPRG